ncbi:kinase-like domain-containing protein, partial [Chytriomyces sp. MP71]
QTKTIIRCVLEALVTAHRKYIVHRDIKPDNLFLFTDELDSVKVGDWGICAEDNGYNCVGGMKGTKGYMAPETLKKMQYGRPVDIYACGVVAYQLIFGILPFPAEPVKKGLFTVKQKLSFPLTFNLSSEGDTIACGGLMFSLNQIQAGTL